MVLWEFHYKLLNMSICTCAFVRAAAVLRNGHWCRGTAEGTCATRQHARYCRPRTWQRTWALRLVVLQMIYSHQCKLKILWPAMCWDIVLRLSSLLCADFFISKEFCMAFRIILIDLYLTYKLVLKQLYNGDLPHQSTLKRD